MPSRSLHARNQTTGQLVPQAFTTTAIDGGDVDISAAEAVEFVFNVGTQSGTSSLLVMQEADDDGAGAADTYADIADADLVGGANDVSITTSTDVAIVRRGYAGTKKWVRVRGEDSTSGNLLLSGHVELTLRRHI